MSGREFLGDFVDDFGEEYSPLLGREFSFWVIVPIELREIFLEFFLNVELEQLAVAIVNVLPDIGRVRGQEQRKDIVFDFCF